MVGIGTIIGGITLVIGAVVGYAIYSNRGKITAATSNIIGGIETSSMSIGQKFATSTENIIPSFEKVTLPNPFTNWFQNWTSSMTQQKFNTQLQQKTKQMEDAGYASEEQWERDTDPNIDRNKFNPPGETGYGYPKEYTPSSRAGYYYQDFAPGGRADRQLKLKIGTADKLRGRGYDLTWLGTAKLGEAGFRLFGQSKGYL